MKLFFPDLVRAIDMGAEAKRLVAVKFAPAENRQAGGRNSEPKKWHAGEARRRQRCRMMPKSLRRDGGERRIAGENPRAAEASFQKVLTKYPDQARAWYGIGLVALLDHDAARAKQVFGRLTAGEHAATQDPWCWRGRTSTWPGYTMMRGIREVARMEYRSVLSVEGGPEQAKQAAQKGLAVLPR